MYPSAYLPASLPRPAGARALTRREPIWARIALRPGPTGLSSAGLAPREARFDFAHARFDLATARGLDAAASPHVSRAAANGAGRRYAARAGLTLEDCSRRRCLSFAPRAHDLERFASRAVSSRFPASPRRFARRVRFPRAHQADTDVAPAARSRTHRRTGRGSVAPSSWSGSGHARSRRRGARLPSKSAMAL